METTGTISAAAFPYAVRNFLSTIKDDKIMASDNDVAEKIKAIVADRLDRKPEEVTIEASFGDDLGADSLDQTELLMALEEEFDVEIDDDANQIETVGQAIDYIKSKL